MTHATDTAGPLAGALIDTVPLIMGVLRHEIRSRRPMECSVPQFRVLAFLRRNEGATLTDVANHIGLMRPTMSKMMEGLVRRGWVERETSTHDRRYMRLRLTPQGSAVINAARDETKTRLAVMLQALGPDQQKIVLEALEVLRDLFSPDPAASPSNDR